MRARNLLERARVAFSASLNKFKLKRVLRKRAKKHLLASLITPSVTATKAYNDKFH